ncbi:AAA family ATPase [Streptomyces sp. NPDC002659]|uniref:helix-turn-helix transcriptional regulator n=1 Tax=Streptomyces sp. NPDC002659 TaxID=3364656 RepID=UPI0036A0F195
MTATALGLWEREGESATVAKAVKDVMHGDGRLLLVEGPAGIGKTRLLAEVRTAAAEVGAQVTLARGTPLERDFAFGVVRQMFEPLLAHLGTAEQERLWQGPAVQARQVFASVDPAAESAGNFAVLHGLYWLTANASQDHPLVLCVDDLQWCDAPSLRYLAYLLPRLEDLGVLVATALRTGESATDDRLLEQITTDPAATVLCPHPLSAHATTLLLERALPGPVDPRFADACHEATGGNPLLLTELAHTLTAEDIRGSAENVALVRDLGSRAVARLVAVRMDRLPEAALTLARAAAILGDQADLTTAAALSLQDTAIALEGAAALERLQILRAEQHDAGLRLAFIHPLVQASVHDSIDRADLATAHHRAAQLLTKAGADPERIAAHLLHTPPVGDPDTVTSLRAAAAAATRRGAPDSAYTYLRRCLDEPPAATQRPPVLLEAGQAALMIDCPIAASLLRQSMEQVTEPASRADVATGLGTAYLYLLKPDLAIKVWTQALERLPPPEEDRRRRLEAALLAATAWAVPAQDGVLGRLPALRRLSPHDSTGADLLDCAVAGCDMANCDPAAVSRARRALANNTLSEQANGHIALAAGWSTLLAADDDMAMDSLHSAIQQAHVHGSLYSLVPAYSHRALGWLQRGQLGEAEQDARESRRLAELSKLDIGRTFSVTVLADTLIEQGRLDEAEQALRTVSDPTAPGPVYFALGALARLQRLRGDRQGALDAALHTRQVCQAYGIRNPAVVGWRTEAVLALHALDRDGEAQQIAAEDLHLARQWGAPRTLGRALRTNGLLAGGEEGLKLLQEAVSVLEASPARLEHARALVDYGAAMRRTGHPKAARDPLRRALDFATQCGAIHVVEQARMELAAAGGRPRHTALTGPAALTPSERRVADLAATGATNRQIAQTLFVTPKTIEVHLSSVYHKLGITTRTQVAKALAHPDGRLDR